MPRRRRHRVGPYRDVKQGRTEYRDFLAETIEAISGYHQDIQRIWSDGDHAVAQLSETMDVDGRPRRTDQAIVLDLGPDGLINRVEVYLQRAYFVEDENGSRADPHPVSRRRPTGLPGDGALRR